MVGGLDLLQEKFGVQAVLFARHLLDRGVGVDILDNADIRGHARVGEAVHKTLAFSRQKRQNVGPEHIGGIITTGLPFLWTFTDLFQGSTW